jgi:hypothetical protein
MFKQKVQAHMNTSKAMCLMGLGVAANVDKAIGEDPTETLNKAIFDQGPML